MCKERAGTSYGSGRFVITWTAENQSFKGYLRAIPPDRESPSDCPENRAGRKR